MLWTFLWCSVCICSTAHCRCLVTWVDAVICHVFMCFCSLQMEAIPPPMKISTVLMCLMKQAVALFLRFSSASFFLLQYLIQSEVLVSYIYCNIHDLILKRCMFCSQPVQSNKECTACVTASATKPPPLFWRGQRGNSCKLLLVSVLSQWYWRMNACWHCVPTCVDLWPCT